jgi:hypothetical protein
MMKLKLKIKSKPTNTGYYIDFKGRCDCGNKIRMKYPFAEAYVNCSCAKCGRKFSFLTRESK